MPNMWSASCNIEIGRNTPNNAAQLEAITAMLDSGVAPPEQLRPLLGNQIQFLLARQQSRRGGARAGALSRGRPQQSSRASGSWPTSG